MDKKTLVLGIRIRRTIYSCWVLPQLNLNKEFPGFYGRPVGDSRLSRHPALLLRGAKEGGSYLPPERVAVWQAIVTSGRQLRQAEITEAREKKKEWRDNFPMHKDLRSLLGDPEQFAMHDVPDDLDLEEYVDVEIS